ncbi:hypothetical protein HQ560_19155, partial [bacterium]|nr:hypothetical protein [bacterium]
MRTRILLVLCALALRTAWAAPPDVVADWLLQDKLKNPEAVTASTITALAESLGEKGAELKAMLGTREVSGKSLAHIYLHGRGLRRTALLAPWLEKMRRVVFV